MWAITGIITEYGEKLLPGVALLAVPALYFLLKDQKRKRKLVTAERYVQMGLRFYDQDERFLSIKNGALRYFLVNEAYTALLGKKKADFLGKRDEDIFDHEMAQKLHEVDRKVLKSGEKIQQDIVWKGRTYRMHKFPLVLPDGGNGIGAYTEDITEAVRRREERERIIKRNEILIDVSAKDFQSSHEQLDYVLRKALALTESTYGYIYLYNEEDRLFTLENFAKDGVVLSRRKSAQMIYSLDRMGLWSESVKTGKPMIYNGTMSSDAEPIKDAAPFNMMTIPVIMESQVTAVIGVANKPNGYSSDDAEELSLLMNGVWNAKERRETTLQLKQANHRLASNKDKLSLILNSSAEGIYGMDVEGNFTFINQSALDLLGYEDAGEVIGTNCHERIHHSTKEGIAVARENCQIYEAIGKGDVLTEENEVFYRKDGSFFSVRYSAHPQIHNGEIIGSVVTFSDITQRKRQEEEVLYLSYHDALTGLYNRTYLDKICADLEEEKFMPMSVVVGDVNGLKLSNDIFGHRKGDEFLKRIAEIIRSHTREEDLLFRVGGDEFYLFLRSTREEEAKDIMGRIANSIREEDFHGVRGGIALGLSVMENTETSLESVMNDAEQKMYREKTITKSEESTRQLKSFVEIIMQREEERVHAENTVHIAEVIGKALSLPEEEMTKLKDAAYIHDIGKITGFMSEGEEKYVLPTRRDHAVIGYRILNSFEETMELARIILSHHEKWDGSGYPKGLKGKEIPLLSRIIAVAERFDRLTSGYSADSLTEEEAFAVMKMESGRVLDSSLVDILMEIREKKVSGI
ncbi:diguanylate cyclase domain-containing protein [Proteiniclasticum sp. C24MP]|uniref:diguanylate cyclase domain-containing protein n=1 Tax=Proteiniclasticum sp. C24MP TaxID=3374101 RepID=UPI003753FA73